MSLKNLKKRQKNFDKLAEKVSGGGRQKDERFWEYTTDKAQNGEAVIRFLPGCEGEEDTPIILFKQYFIDTPKGKFVADAPENAGLKSFPAEVASDVWGLFKKTNDERYKTMFKERVSNEAYIANIYVVKDPANPENEGKVFLFKFGRYIKNVIFEQMGIEEEKSKKKKESSILIDNKPKEPYDPFDLWEGANFYITSYSKSGKAINRTYEDSKFLEQSPLSNDDAELERIYSQVYSLQEFVSPDYYKESYEDMKTRYIEMTGDYYDLFPEKGNGSDTSGGTYNRPVDKKDTSSITNTNSKFEDDDEDEDFSKPLVTPDDDDISIGSDDDDDEDLDDIYASIMNG